MLRGVTVMVCEHSRISSHEVFRRALDSESPIGVTATQLFNHDQSLPKLGRQLTASTIRYAGPISMARHSFSDEVESTSACQQLRLRLKSLNQCKQQDSKENELFCQRMRLLLCVSEVIMRLRFVWGELFGFGKLPENMRRCREIHEPSTKPIQIARTLALPTIGL